MKFSQLINESESNIIFSKEFIETIAIWQEYGIDGNRDPFIKKLDKLNIPLKFKVCNNYVYRVMALDNLTIDSLNNYSKIFTNVFSSWSLDLKIVENFQKEDIIQTKTSDNKNMKSVFFKYKPNQDRIFLNLDILWKDKDWIKDISYYRKQGVNFESGLSFENTQREVILRTIELNKLNIIKII